LTNCLDWIIFLAGIRVATLPQQTLTSRFILALGAIERFCAAAGGQTYRFDFGPGRVAPGYGCEPEASVSCANTFGDAKEASVTTVKAVSNACSQPYANDSGLPASPFRTDDWPGPTDGKGPEAPKPV
jgi:hypothetical protein